jgi:hypothetical protein
MMVGATAAFASLIDQRLRPPDWNLPFSAIAATWLMSGERPMDLQSPVTGGATTSSGMFTLIAAI